MNDNLKQRVQDVDRDLSPAWVELSTTVRNLAADLKLKAAGSQLAHDADHLCHEASRLCDHVDRLHQEVIDLLENVETHLPLAGGDRNPPDLADDDIVQEKLQIQRESHELRSDFKDVLKALFMWRDDPVERVRDKK